MDDIWMMTKWVEILWDLENLVFTAVTGCCWFLWWMHVPAQRRQARGRRF